MTRTTLSGVLLLTTLSAHANAVQFFHQPDFQWQDPPGRYYDADCLVATRTDGRQQNPELGKKAVRGLFGRRGQFLYVCQMANPERDIAIYVKASANDAYTTGHGFSYWIDEAPDIAETHCVRFIRGRSDRPSRQSRYD